MSGTSSPNAGITRRGFVKGAAAVGALGAIAGGMATTSEWLAPAPAAAEVEEKVAYVRHQFHCLGECCLKCTVRGGRLALIEPNDALPEENQHICLRGINEIQHVYATDRIQTPLKRVGERGEGKFEAISWDEAIKTVADAIKESQEKYGEGSFFCRKSTEASVAHGFEYIVQLLRGDSGGRWGLDRGQANGWDPGVGAWSFLPSNSAEEFKDAATLIFLGDNILESGIIWSHGLFDAKEAGTYTVSVDPRFSPTSGKCDQWLPVKPGTDTALIQGMIRAIVDNGWYDEEFMLAHTGFPFLVDQKSGKVLVEVEQAVDPETGEDLKDPETGDPVMNSIPLVWDTATKSARRHDAKGVKPALSGTFTHDGKKCATEWTSMLEHYKDLNIEWASETSGIPEADIEALAKRYATAGPAMIAFGLGGPDKYTNADVLGHSLVLLTAMTGNIGKKGAGTAWYGAGGATHSAESLNAWTLPEEFHYGDTGLSMYDYPYKENDIHVALTFGDAFTLEAGNANKMLEWVKSLDFFAIVDIYHSSIVDYADIVMPACTKFELDGEIGQVRDGKDLLSVSTKALDPLFESKTDLEIERLLAAQWGLEKYLPESYEELARFQLSSPSGNMEGFTLEALLQNQGAMRYIGAEIPRSSEPVFGTDSGKIEPYYEMQLENGQQWPTWETPNESHAQSPLYEKYPMQFMQGKTRYRIHAYYSASSWFQEYLVPSVNISPADAAARGIKTDDDVRIFNDRGEFVARALVNPGIMDGTLFMAETTYNHYYKSGFLQNVTNDAKQERCYDMRYGPQIPYNDTLVQIEKA